MFQVFLQSRHAMLLPNISMGPFKTQFRNQDVENIFKEKPLEHTQHCSRLLLHIHKHPASPHYKPQHNTIQVGHCCVKKPPCNSESRTRGPSIPGYVLGARALLFRDLERVLVPQAGPGFLSRWVRRAFNQAGGASGWVH